MVSLDTELILRAEENAKHVVLANKATLETYRHLNARKLLHIGSESIWLDYLGIMLPKKSPLKRPFDLM